ncbi:MAG: sugar ABC transporter permease [Clostridiaceae bacterium]|nr:sugar ABC transporter permease [Clostridiaceae bacterium]
MILVFFFLVIPVVLMMLLSYYPAFKLLQLSLTDWNGLSKTYHYVGFNNFKEIFGQPELMKVFTNNGAYVIVMLIQQVVGLYFAIVLNSKIRAKNFFKSFIFMPYILNGVAIAFMFSFMYDFQNGPVNLILNNLGLGKYAIHFLSENYSTNFSLAFIGFWKYVGLTMVLYLAALQSISTELYEASKLDGANFFQNIIYITIPNIKRMISISLILGFNGAMQAYFEAFVITKGGPNGVTDTFITKTLYIAFTNNKFGKASAMGVILVFIIVVIVCIQRIFLREDVS